MFNVILEKKLCNCINDGLYDRKEYLRLKYLRTFFGNKKINNIWANDLIKSACLGLNDIVSQGNHKEAKLTHIKALILQD